MKTILLAVFAALSLFVSSAFAEEASFPQDLAAVQAVSTDATAGETPSVANVVGKALGTVFRLPKMIASTAVSGIGSATQNFRDGFKQGFKGQTAEAEPVVSNVAGEAASAEAVQSTNAPTKAVLPSMITRAIALLSTPPAAVRENTN